MELKVWEPSDSDNLTNSVIFQITQDISSGKADPEQAKRLLKLFGDCSNWAEAAMLPDELFKFFKDAIKGYLDNPKNGGLESGLGLRRTKGAPQKNRNRNHQIAWKVLQGMLAGKSLEGVSFDLVDVFKIPDNKIRDIWAANKAQALDFEAVYRTNKAKDKKTIWNSEEKTKLRKIYGGCIKG
jgi:hypothetical protein